MNRGITAPRVRVALEDGTQLGILLLQDALDRAYREGLDLVEIVPHAQPPVCKIMDYGRYKYEKSRQAKQQRKQSKVADQKMIRLRPVTGDHDLQVKLGAARKFLQEGHKIQFVMRFRSKREMIYRDQGWAIFQSIIAALKDAASVEGTPSFQERQGVLRLTPLSK